MITARTKKQLIVFVIITLLGVTFVGARYARLDRLFYDSAYTVNAHFAQSGGIFTGAEVTYRGVGIGQVSNMKLTDKGVDVLLAIDKGSEKIPKDSSPWSATSRPSVSSTSSSSRSPTTGPTSRTARRSTPRRPQIPVSTTEILTNPATWSARSHRPTCARWSRSPERRSMTPVRAWARSSTPRARSSRRPTTTSRSPRR